MGLSLLDTEEAEAAYTAFCKAAKGVSTEPFLRRLVAAADAPLTQHQALVLYYMKVYRFAHKISDILMENYHVLILLC